MSASDHLSEQQFMPAHQLHGLFMMDEPSYGSKKELVRAKHLENIRSGLHTDVRDNGVKTPVKVLNDDDGQYLLKGHHRVVAAFKANPNMMVPVEHVR